MRSLFCHATLFFCITIHSFSHGMHLDIDCIHSILALLENQKCISYPLQKIIRLPNQPQSIIPTTLLQSHYATDQANLELNNSEENTKVFPSAQLWPSVHTCEGIKLTNGTERDFSALFFHNTLKNDTYHPGLFIFDGFNRHNTVLFSKQRKGYYELFACRLQKSRAHKNITPLYNGSGKVASLMLENNRNRFIYTIDQESQASQPIYKLYIKELVESNTPYYTECSHVKVLSTEHLFTKIVNLGKDTYFGIAKGLLYCFWLTKNNSINLAHQKCSLLLKDIAVDLSCVTQTGFHPKIAFLTRTGKIYITHLNGYEQPTLLHATTVKDPHKIIRLFYDKGKLIIMYHAQQKTVYEINDNFDFLYASSLLKTMYKEIHGTPFCS